MTNTPSGQQLAIYSYIHISIVTGALQNTDTHKNDYISLVTIFFFNTSLSFHQLLYTFSLTGVHAGSSSAGCFSSGDCHNWHAYYRHIPLSSIGLGDVNFPAVIAFVSFGCLFHLLRFLFGDGEIGMDFYVSHLGTQSLPAQDRD